MLQKFRNKSLIDNIKYFRKKYGKFCILSGTDSTQNIRSAQNLLETVILLFLKSTFIYYHLGDLISIYVDGPLPFPQPAKVDETVPLANFQLLEQFDAEDVPGEAVEVCYNDQLLDQSKSLEQLNVPDGAKLYLRLANSWQSADIGDCPSGIEANPKAKVVDGYLVGDKIIATRVIVSPYQLYVFDLKASTSGSNYETGMF
jgi:hypothetical protein